MFSQLGKARSIRCLAVGVYKFGRACHRTGAEEREKRRDADPARDPQLRDFDTIHEEGAIRPLYPRRHTWFQRLDVAGAIAQCLDRKSTRLNSSHSSIS